MKLKINQKSLAYLISRIMDPVILVCVIAILVVAATNLSRLDAFMWLVIMLSVGVVAPLFIFFIGRRMGKISDTEITKRAERVPYYTAVIICWAILILVLLSFDAPHFMIVIMEIPVILGVLFVAITFFWKISVHTGIYTMFALSLVILYGRIYFIALLGLLIVGWARMKLGQHNIWQLVIGTILAAIIFLVILYSNGVQL